MRLEKKIKWLSFFLVLIPLPAFANDFPTQARVEFVVGCMNEMGEQSYSTMYACVCAIDKIAEQFSYDEFSEAQVFRNLRATAGERGGVFRDPDRASILVDKLQQVVSQSNKSCSVRKPSQDD